MTKLHRNLVDAVTDGFLQICNDNLYADKVIERLLKRDKRWGSKDRAFIAETLYDMIRWKRLLLYFCTVCENNFCKKNFCRLGGFAWLYFT